MNMKNAPVLSKFVSVRFLMPRQKIVAKSLDLDFSATPLHPPHHTTPREYGPCFFLPLRTVNPPLAQSPALTAAADSSLANCRGQVAAGGLVAFGMPTMRNLSPPCSATCRLRRWCFAYAGPSGEPHLHRRPGWTSWLYEWCGEDRRHSGRPIGVGVWRAPHPHVTCDAISRWWGQGAHGLGPKGVKQEQTSKEPEFKLRELRKQPVET